MNLPIIQNPYETLLNNLRDPVILYDNSGQILWVNKRMQKNLGREFDESKSLHIRDIIKPVHKLYEEDFSLFFKPGFLGLVKLILNHNCYEKDAANVVQQNIGPQNIGTRANVIKLNEDNFICTFTETLNHMTTYFSRYRIDYFALLDMENRIVEYNDYFFDKFSEYKDAHDFHNMHISEFLEDGSWELFQKYRYKNLSYLKGIEQIPQNDWTLTHNDNFNNDLKESWKFGKNSQWHSKNNILIGDSIGEYSFAILKKNLPITELDIKIEFEAKTDLNFGFSAFLGGLHKSFRASPDSNGFLFSVDSDGFVIKKDATHVTSKNKVENKENKWYKICIEKTGGKYSFSIDNKTILEHYDLDIQYRPAQSACGLISSPKAKFKNFKVYTRDSKLDSEELLHHKNDLKMRYFPQELYKARIQEGVYPYFNKKNSFHPSKAVKIIHFQEVTELRQTQQALNNTIKHSQSLMQENKILKTTLIKRSNIGIGNSESYNKVRKLIKNVADSESHVLFTGETGTGKDMAANELHLQSDRRENPFVKIDCAALPPQLLESELFGHEKGSFTGAVDKKIGRFEAAENGTIFLDEIGNLELNLQSKLLRVLQDKCFERVGGTKTLRTNARIISATNIDLEERIENGEFRSDLYYRINTITICLPTLKKRSEDIPLLANHFITEICKSNKREIPRIDPAFYEFLQKYPWPGNIRELRNTIEYAILMSNGDGINLKSLPSSVLERKQESYNAVHSINTLFKRPSELSKVEILDALEKTNGNLSKTALELGIGRQSLYRVMDRYELRKSN